MDSSIFSLFLLILSILISRHNVQGAFTKMVNKMSNAMSDTNNLFKHEIRLTTQEGLCSGTIISDKFVLTAAHCVIVKGSNRFIGIDRQLMEVTVGITEVKSSFEFQTVRLVEKIYVPRVFINIDKTNNDLMKIIGDIALLKLNHKLGLGKNPRIEALAMPTYEFAENEIYERNSVIFTGFGATRAIFNRNIQDYEAGKFPSYLQYLKARVLPPSSCKLLGNAELKMCAKLLRDGAGICGGDSGGALINYERKAIIGVLSYGPKMCNGVTPGVYTKVFPYNRFIVNAVYGVVDETARLQSFEAHPNYRNALQMNALKYQRINYQF